MGRLGPITDRRIRMEREYKRLEKLAQEQGYDSVYTMLYDLYIVKKTPLKVLAATLFTPMWTLRKRLEMLGIEMRSRGGRNNVKVEITPELLQEVGRDGISAVSERLGITYTSLSLRLRKYVEEVSRGQGREDEDEETA